MNDITIGLQLMLIGMVTVFVILLIVIYGSKLIISVLNRLAPEEKKPASVAGDIPVAVLEAAVAQLTGAKGKIVKITEL